MWELFKCNKDIRQMAERFKSDEISWQSAIHIIVKITTEKIKLHTREKKFMTFHELYLNSHK